MKSIPGFTEAYALEQSVRVKKIVEDHNGSDFTFANTPAEKEELWKVHMWTQVQLVINGILYWT